MDKSIRRSTRVKKVPASYSPPPTEKLSSSGKGRKKGKCGRDIKKTEFKDYSYDVTPDGQPFTCDMCGSPYVIDPYKRKKIGITKRLLPRQRLDPATGQHLMLCNACGIAKMRQIKSNHRPHIKYTATEEEKEQYLKEAKAFADSLVTNLGDSAAEKLYCPRFTSKPCRCIQTYLINGDDNDGYRQRAIYLIKLIRLAQKYSSLKCYDINDVIGPDGKKGKVGMGRGHKKSKVYEDFVMTQRTQLKNQYNLCEVAIKRILCYSNNFLFKKLKSQESECRIEKVKGRGKKSANLIPIDKLAQEKCCHGKCTVMALSHMTLLQEWRDRAGQGQTEARRVIAEMLTPSGLHTNCYAFIRMVTGVTSTVISSVSNYMRETGGRRDPPPHGLKTFWENHPKRRKLESKAENMKQSQDNIVEVIVSVPENDRSNITDQRRSDAITSNDILDGNPADGLAVMTDGKAICLADTSQTIEQITSNQSSATNVMVLESAATLSTPDDHLELMPFCNPDGSTQMIQVPIIAYSNLEGDNLLQDLNLQIPVDPGSLVLDGSSSFLDNSGIILDVPTLPHSVLQNPSAARSQLIPESGPQSAAMETNALKEGSHSSETQIQDLIVLQSSSDASRKCEIKMHVTESQLVLRNRDSELKDTIQTTLKQSDVAEVRQQVFIASNDGEEPAMRMLNMSDCQIGDCNVNKDISLASLKNSSSTNVGQHFLADAFYKIQNNVSSSELHCSASDTDLALQANTLYVDSSKVLPSAPRPIQGTSSLPCPPNAEVLSTRNFESISSATLHTSKYLISSVNTPDVGSAADVSKVKSPAPNYIVVSSQQHPSTSSVQTATAESTHLASSLLTSQKDSKTGLPPNFALLVPEVIPVSSSTTKLDRQNVKLTDKNILGMLPTSVALREMLWQPTVVKSACVTGQSDVTVNSGQSISHSLLPEAKPTQATLAVKEWASVPVKRTSVDGVSTMRLATATKLHLVTTTTTVGQSGKTLATTITSSTGDKHQNGRSKPGTILQSKSSDHTVLGGSITQPSILPKPLPSSTLATHFPPDVSLPMIVSTAAPSQVVLSPGIVPSSVPGVMLSSLVNPIPKFVMPVVTNKNIATVTTSQPNESLQVTPAAALKGAAPVQGLQFASGNTIILHNATSQRGGSFSLQHLANQRTGSVAVEHGQGSIYITRAPNSDIQFVQPVIPRVVVPPPVEQINSLQQTTGGVMTVQQTTGGVMTVQQTAGGVMTVQQALAPVTTQQQLLQTVTTRLPTATTSSRKHLKEMLPVLPTTITTSKHKS